MIKKLFGKFLKLPFLLLIVALTGVMVWEATNLANKYGSDFRDQIFFAEENGRKVGFLGKQEELFKELKLLK